jgi:hypothetical protein
MLKAKTKIILSALAFSGLVAAEIFIEKTLFTDNSDYSSALFTPSSFQTASKPEITNDVHVKETYKKIEWEDLMPKNWDPEKYMPDFDSMEDGDPFAALVLEEMKFAMSHAPAVQSFNNVNVRIWGFVAPIEYKGEQITEFLLVPYFGGCIHVPPPPSNQIIYIKSNNALPTDVSEMSVVWVEGKLEVNHNSSNIGDSSYFMKADHVGNYTESNWPPL